MRHAIARWMAKKLRKRQKFQQSIRWHELWGVERMSVEERIEYAGLLHECGKSGKAVEVLTALLQTSPDAHAYERRAHIYNEIGREEEAIADLDASIELDSEPYLVWYTRAISHNNRGNYELAVRDFREVLLRRKDSKASTHYELGNVYMKMGAFEEAATCYANAFSNPGESIPHYYFRHAQAQEKLNRTDEARRSLALAIELQMAWRGQDQLGAANYKARTRYSPAAIRTFIQGADEECGFLLYESKLKEADGDLEGALQSVLAALEIYPQAEELRLREGHMLWRLDRPKEAEEALTRMMDESPRWLPAFMELSAMYRSQERTDDAIRVLTKAKQRFPEHPVVRYWLVDMFRESGRSEEARAESLELIGFEPDDPLNWKQYAEILIDAAAYGDAGEAFTQALKLEPSAESYMRRSYSRYMEDRYEEAMLDVQAAIQLDESLNKESKTSYALAELYMGMGNTELADGEYSRALALDPENPQIYDRRARCRFAAERWADALEDCNRGMQLTGSNPRAIWLRGLIRYRLDDLDGALEDIENFTLLVPDDAQGFFNLGHLYKHLGRHDDAIAAFTKVIGLDPFDAKAYLERASIWYHHYFDRTRAVDDLAQWLLYTEVRSHDGDRFELLNEIRGFDDEMRERAKEQYSREYGGSRYLS